MYHFGEIALTFEFWINNENWTILWKPETKELYIEFTSGQLEIARKYLQQNANNGWLLKSGIFKLPFSEFALTTAGKELFKIIPIEDFPSYKKDLDEFFAKKHLKLIELKSC